MLAGLGGCEASLWVDMMCAVRAHADVGAHSEGGTDVACWQGLATVKQVSGLTVLRSAQAQAGGP